ncbi:hypothetical protein KDL01_31795 [Actinospica durhamensis]|uniref:NUDIX hydrolase n=1 Tax=Actinospica durhamensis TaxID=1508375 RepID=A0A941IQP1_9ACTN|nr:hypothetical protein [Actinospica durhamensis]MBR7837900.1 hypothetical protein [Actinospica durhamensis]
MRVDTEEARDRWHWWSIAELATTHDTVRPKKLAMLLADVLVADPQGPPVDLGHFDEDADPE